MDPLRKVPPWVAKFSRHFFGIDLNPRIHAVHDRPIYWSALMHTSRPWDGKKWIQPIAA